MRRPPSLIQFTLDLAVVSTRSASLFLLPFLRLPRDIACSEPRSANRRRDVKHSLGTWLPRSGQHVPIERVATPAVAHHAATSLYQQTLAPPPPQAAVELHQRRQFHPNLSPCQPHRQPQTARHERAAHARPGPEGQCHQSAPAHASPRRSQC